MFVADIVIIKSHFASRLARWLSSWVEGEDTAKAVVL